MWVNVSSLPLVNEENIYILLIAPKVYWDWKTDTEYSIRVTWGWFLCASWQLARTCSIHSGSREETGIMYKREARLGWLHTQDYKCDQHSGCMSLAVTLGASITWKGLWASSLSHGAIWFLIVPLYVLLCAFLCTWILCVWMLGTDQVRFLFLASLTSLNCGSCFSNKWTAATIHFRIMVRLEWQWMWTQFCLHWIALSLLLL